MLALRLRSSTNLDIGGTIEYLELIAHVMLPDEMRNRVEYVPARS